MPACHDILEIFKRDGYVVVPDMVSPADLQQLRFMVDQVLDGSIVPDIAEPDSDEPLADFEIQYEPQSINVGAMPRRDQVRVVFHLCHCHRFFESHALRPEIVQVAQTLLGSPPRLYTDQTFVKPPRHGSEVPFHQDHFYWKALEPYNMVSCWLALDDATVENGCVRMVRGSHHALVPHRQFDGPNGLGLLPRDVDLSQETLVEVKAGSAMFHHSLTIHRSLPNRSDRRRRGLVTIYAPSAISFVEPWNFRYGFRLVTEMIAAKAH